MATAVYSLILHHLSPDAKAAGLAYPDEQLLAVSLDQLRELLNSLRDVAARMSPYEPSAPEIRIKTERDTYIIRTRYRQLCLVGWEQALRGEEHTVAYIVSKLTGTAEPSRPASREERPATTASVPLPAKSAETDAIPRSVKIGVLTFLIIALNATAVWLLLRPPARPVHELALLSEFESRALLTKVAGEYETGGREGDRRLVIDSDGTLHLGKYGPNRGVASEDKRTARGALSDGRAVLVTNDPYIVAIKDSNHVVLYGNTYARRIH
jgi:hypothetical protein